MATLATSPSENDFHLGRCDLKYLLQDMAALLSDYANQKGISTKLIFPETQDSLWILTSEEEAQLVLYNLISNAIKYSYSSLKGNERIVDILVIDANSHYKVEIKNLGVGIQPDEVQNVFKVGYRGALSLDRDRTSLGIGLYTAKQLINSLKGDIVISSEKTDTTNNRYLTTTSVTFPKYKEEKI